VRNDEQAGSIFDLFACTRETRTPKSFYNYNTSFDNAFGVHRYFLPFNPEHFPLPDMGFVVVQCLGPRGSGPMISSHWVSFVFRNFTGFLSFHSVFIAYIFTYTTRSLQRTSLPWELWKPGRTTLQLHSGARLASDI
jgi:hypothetical protein